MLKREFIKTLSASMAKPEIRPSLAGIEQVDTNTFVSTDSYRITKVTQSSMEGNFPDTKAFLESGVEYEEVDVAELTIAANLAIDIAKNNHATSKLTLNGKLSFASEGDDQKSIPMESFLAHGEATAVSAVYLSEFLKSVKNFTKNNETQLFWYQRNALSILQFKLITSSGIIEHGIMPIKV